MPTVLLSSIVKTATTLEVTPAFKSVLYAMDMTRLMVTAEHVRTPVNFSLKTESVCLSEGIVLVSLVHFSRMVSVLR